MVFEDVGTMLFSINLFETSIFVIIIGLIFALSRGISKSGSEMTLYMILFGAFATILLFTEDVMQTFLFVIVAVLILLWGWKYMGRED